MASGKMIIIGELELDGAPVRALMEIRPKGEGIVWQPGNRRIIVEVEGPEIQARSLSGKATLKAGEGLLQLVLPGLLASCAKYAIVKVFETLARDHIESVANIEAPLPRHDRGAVYSIDLMQVATFRGVLARPFKVPSIKQEVRLEDFLRVSAVRFVRHGAAFSVELQEEHPAVRAARTAWSLASVAGDGGLRQS